MSIRDKDGLTEAEFLAAYDSDQYERPSVTTDIALFAVSSSKLDNYRKLPEKQLEILLIKRGGHPYLGKWALPGGFLRPGETLEQAAYRELKEETGVDTVYLEQLFAFSDPDRDPRGWIMTEAFLALADKRGLSLQAGDDADEAAWFTVRLSTNERSVWTLELIGQNEILKATLTEATTARQRALKTSNSVQARHTAQAMYASQAHHTTQTQIITGREASPLVAIDSDLAFDHASIISYAIERMRNKVDYTGLAFNLLPRKFTLTDLQQVYELILGRELLTPAFRRKIANYVIATDEFTQNAGHRPSRLYVRREEDEKALRVLE